VASRSNKTNYHSNEKESSTCQKNTCAERRMGEIKYIEILSKDVAYFV